MRKLTILLGFFLINQAEAQVNEKVLADTVQFIIRATDELQCARYEQRMVRLNFDDCNLEIHHTPTDDLDKWNIYSFWLPNLDETKMKLEPTQEEEWALVLNAMSSDLKYDRNTEIQYDRHDGSGYTTKVFLYASEKEQLVTIGQALNYATRQCKGLDRFKK